MCVCINRGASKSYQNIKKIDFTGKIQNSLPSKSEGPDPVNENKHVYIERNFFLGKIPLYCKH